MNDQDTKKILLGLLHNIAPDIDTSELGMEDHIREELGIDSFDFLQFIVALDETFGIQTPEEDYGKIATLHSLINYVNLARQPDPN